MDFRVRSDRRPQGRMRLVRERAAYLLLVEQGVGFTAAARIVGVDPSTGRIWRRGDPRRVRRRVWPVRTGPPGPISARFLSQDERLLIADLHGQKVSIRQIAARLDRPPSTISRELTRNGGSSGSYHPWTAGRAAADRRARPKMRKLDADPALHAAVQDGLNQKWSPKQISNRLRATFPDRPEMRVSTETIYQALYVQGRGQLRRELTGALRTGRARRRPQRDPQRRRSRFVDPMVMISERPAEAEDRAIPGHWEGDLIMGAGNSSCIGTLVERTTRYVMLLHLPDGHDAGRVSDALIETVSTLPTHLRRSLTWDQGSEMAGHLRFKIATGMPVFFCDPASPWQRGSNENTNGLLRQYFPKATDLSRHNRERLAEVAIELNGRPRETLNWATPAEALAKLLET